MSLDALYAFIVFQGVFFFLDCYIIAKTNRDIARQGEYGYFIALILIHMAYLLLNSVWSLGEYEVISLPHWGTTILVMGSLMSICSCPFVFFRFTIEKIRFLPLQRKPWKQLSMIPALASVFLILASPWTQWAFSLDEADNIIHGPLYPFMLLSSSLYLVAVAVIAVHNMRTARTTARRRASGVLLLSVVIIILFVLLDSMFLQASILPSAVFAVIIVIFTTMQESNINSDALTGMNNRRKADDYLTGALTSVSPQRPLVLYMGDMNSFKAINDIYGHLEGDEALVLCGNVLKRTVSHYNGFAARFGGDEFLMSRRLEESGADPDDLCRDVNRELERISAEMKKPYSLNMSIGYAVCADPAESLSSCISRADEMLYARKQAFHHHS